MTSSMEENIEYLSAFIYFGIFQNKCFNSRNQDVKVS